MGSCFHFTWKRVFQETVTVARVLRLYRHQPLNEAELFSLKLKLRSNGFDVDALSGLDREWVFFLLFPLYFRFQCFNVEILPPIEEDQLSILTWLLEETFEPDSLSPNSTLISQNNGDGMNSGSIVEIGPRLNFSTPWSTNAVSICRSCGLNAINRIEKSIRYRLQMERKLTSDDLTLFGNAVRKEKSSKQTLFSRFRIE